MDDLIDEILHPLIYQFAYQKFVDGHLRSAVLDAFITVFDLIRARTGLQLDGSDLAGRAFSLADPRLIVSELDTESGKSDQKGFLLLLQGAYQSIRNPKAHSIHSDLTEVAALQYLVFASLLARRIDEAKLGNFLRYDGVYMSEGDGLTIANIRFYEEGEVLVCSTPENASAPSKIMNRMRRENPVQDFAKGTYSRNGSQITFSVTRETIIGEIEYKGDILGDTLRLHIHAHSSGHRAQKEFRFYPEKSYWQR